MYIEHVVVRIKCTKRGRNKTGKRCSIPVSGGSHSTQVSEDQSSCHTNHLFFLVTFLPGLFLGEYRFLYLLLCSFPSLPLPPPFSPSLFLSTLLSFSGTVFRFPVMREKRKVRFKCRHCVCCMFLKRHLDCYQ